MSIELKNADAFVELPLLAADSVDLIVTDIPYMSYASRGKTKNEMHGVFDEKAFYLVAQLLYRVLKPTRHIYYWTQEGEPYIRSIQSLQSVGFSINRTLVWTKINQTKCGDFAQTYPSQLEFCIFAEKISTSGGRTRLNGALHSNLLSEFPNIPAERMVHETQKPVGLAELFISRSSVGGELILDPFAGSGSTAFACRNTGRRFLGFEIDEAHFKKTVFRLSL